MILGIDLGASSTDFVLMGKRRVLRKKSIPAIGLSELEEQIIKLKWSFRKVSHFSLTGGMSFRAKNSLIGFPVKKVNEIKAIGAGGLFVSGKKRALVVSLGTGTCIVNAKGNEFKHCCGTGVGGGTMLGLAKHLLGTTDWVEISRLAENGDLQRIDLQVQDIIGKGIGRLPGHATAANFARQGKTRKSDIALGIINLIAETNAVIICLAAEECGQKEIVLTGKLLAVPMVRKRLLAGLRLLGKKAIVPKNYDIATAIGACVFAQTI